MTVYVPVLTLTLNKSQLHCSGVMQWWARSSLMSAPLPAEAGCETCERMFYRWFLLRNNNMAQIFN